MPLKLDDDVSDIDAEIAMLEKKLGNSDKLKKELEDDGLEYLHDVIDNLGKASDTSDGDEQSGDDEVAMSDDDADDEERLVAIQEATEKRKRKQAHLYGDESVVRTESAYVPPHARAARVETGLTKMITGQLNRLSVDNIETIATTLKTVFESHPRGTLCDIIAQVSLGLVLSYRTTSPPPSIPALITYLTAHCGSEVAAGFLERLAPALVDARQSGTNDSGLPSALRAGNLVRTLSSLYEFQVIDCGLIYDLIRLFASGLTEVDVELLLVLLTGCGRQLRRDDPAALKEIIVLIQSKTVGDQPPRVQFMLQTIYDLKNNKIRVHEQHDESLRNWLAQICGPKSAETQLHVSWQDLTADHKRTGRWWLGSAKRSTTFSEAKESPDDRVKAVVEKDPDLLAKARARRLTTDVQLAVFCIIMGSSDYLDAFEKLVRLGLRPPADRDVVFVLFDCCGHERAWNPFYAFLAAKLCSFHRAMKFTFQKAFRDVFKTLPESNKRRAANLGHLLAHLIGQFSISLSHLKIVDLAACRDTPTTVFFIVLFKSLLQLPDRVVGACFERISASSELQTLRDSMAVFIHRHLTPLPNLAPKISLALRCMEKTSALESVI
ncbi:hypothetical protein PBRA_001088 [Plasmodiophora brassicae]|nr:hypothetical protein PBRA_001088 [Plasmodiophora brassicae]